MPLAKSWAKMGKKTLFANCSSKTEIHKKLNSVPIMIIILKNGQIIRIDISQKKIYKSPTNMKMLNSQAW
jgi:hypothetical protein